MTDNEFLLFDRITKIQSVINQYGEDNFYISYSGGKDSTVLHELVDMALPDNRIPRVYANTGIEYKMIRDFVKAKAEKDNRVVMLSPNVKIQTMLQTVGYPFKSKRHSKWVAQYQKSGRLQGIENYLASEKRDKDLYRPCPKIMIGIMRDEGGRRAFSDCLAFQGGKLRAFHPLIPVTKAWEEWFIDEYKIDICDIYKPPYNLERTGCKGCPFALHLQEELDTLQEFFPNERKQCEAIWKPVYDEYRKLNYRLTDGGQMKWF